MTTLETSRLILRPFRAADLAAFYAMGSHPEVIRHVGNRPFSGHAEASAALAAGPLRDYEVHGYGRFACVLKESGEVIGFSGLKFMEEIEETELGYRLMPEHWGQGLATEAGSAALDFAKENLGLSRVIGLVHPENAASAHVLRKLGFEFESQILISWLEGQAVDKFSTTMA